MWNSILYYHTRERNEHARNRIHNDPQCLVLARLNGVGDKDMSACRSWGWAASNIKDINPCAGCGEPIYRGEPIL